MFMVARKRGREGKTERDRDCRENLGKHNKENKIPAQQTNAVNVSDFTKVCLHVVIYPQPWPLT